MLKRILLALVLLGLVCLAVLYVVGLGTFGSHEGPGVVTQTPRDADMVARIGAAQRRAAERAGVVGPKQILFGDLHVHTTFSFDAFTISLPLTQGEGSHPPADACDYARFCSALDFWSINDHAEGISPRNWRETVDSIRQCNAVAGDPSNPDLVSFLGWEWTQVGFTPEDHYGHKNVILKDTEDDKIPARPIAAASTRERIRKSTDFPIIGMGAFALAAGDSRYHDLVRYFAERRNLATCEAGVDVRELPTDCVETAATAGDLFRKLDEWGYESMVIPHGTTWGFYTPPGSTWDKQLTGAQHDPARQTARQTLFEIYSGHGTSEVYRDWRGVLFDEQGNATCPEPSEGYRPTCWRAGELVRERCRAEGVDDAECDQRAAEARSNAAAALGQAHLTVPGATAADWLDAGQCLDCAQPAFNYRPGGSAQYVMALRNFDDPERPMRFRFGFMSSSDNHFARPGTGYKEVHRRGFTESRNRNLGAGGPLAAIVAPPMEEPVAHSRAFDRDNTSLVGFQLMELERQASFFMTGGLIAAHSEGRDRDAIWDAMARREVYGTSGPRILLWFDLLNPPGTSGGSLPMGSQVEMPQNPIFRVRAVGSFEQKPGCPEAVGTALGTERLEHVCKGECYNPSDRRRLITRIEVVRIQPQERADEPVSALIRDPWRTFSCEPDVSGCTVVFEDPDYARERRDTLYYVRAVEEPAPAINAAGVRCEYDANGECVKVDLCGGPDDGDCLAEHEPRAWSSPVFVDYRAVDEAAR